MKNLKKIAATAMALLTMCAVPSLGACRKGGETSSSSSSSEETLGACAVKGHGYDYSTGLCVRCEKKAVIPALPSKQKFPLVEPCPHEMNNCPDCDYTGTGESMWNRLELMDVRQINGVNKEGCYTVEIGAKGVLWLSFSVAKAGQYVFHTVGGNQNVKVTRHAANDHYVNEKGIPATVENGDSYVYDNCGEGYFNPQWRSTYSLTGAAGTRIKIRFIYIDEPAWEPATIHTKIYATELKQKAEDMPSDKELVDVPYDTKYFFDEEKGCYRMGTKEEPGEIIYAAIDTPALRLFGEAEEGDDFKFTNLLKNSGTALNITDGLTENDDYNVLCYTPFIMNWKDDNASWGSRPGADAEEPEANPDKVCYQNYCNNVGVYPVNKELFKFLNLYVKAHKPVDNAISNEDWVAQKDYLWLSACYYYGQVDKGTESNPYIFTEGTFVVDLPALNYLYCSFEGNGSYTLQCAEGIEIKIDGMASQAANGTTLTVESGVPLRFTLVHTDYEAVEDLAITFTKNQA